MEKHTVNLIIQKGKEPLFLHKLRFLLPILSIVSLLIFFAAWVTSVVYINTNLSQFNHLKAQAQQLKLKVAARKSEEGIYILTAKRLEVLSKLFPSVKNYDQSFDEISKLQTYDVEIRDVAMNSGGNFTFSITASSAANLDGLVSYLLTQEESKVFSNIEAQSILRDKTGRYNLTISLKTIPTFKQ